VSARLTARSLIREVIDGFTLFEGPSPAIPHHVAYGRNPLAVVVGGNAAGKSVFRRFAGKICRDRKTEFIGLSMEARAGGSMGVVKAFVYGDESSQATGACSAGLITTGIRTCRGRSSGHVIFWDEPDTGMSDELAAGSGRLILDLALEKPEHTKAIFVVSHNRYLVRELLAANPHYVHLGSNPCGSLKEWCDRPVEPADPQAVMDEGLERFRRIIALIEGKK
jgi:hypothetical protein